MSDVFETKKITELSESTSAADSDLMMIGDPSTGELSKITKDNYLSEIKNNLSALTQDNAGAHNCVVRGKSLGTSVTSEQWAAIKAGTFDDIYLGDYWTLNGYDFLVADFDYDYNTGDTQCKDHHIAMIPRGRLYTGSMNDSDTTDGAYIGSKMYQEGLDEALSIVQSAFGEDHILQHSVYFQNAISSGRPSGGAWSMEYLEIPDEQMIYGMPIRQQMSSGGTGYATTTVNIRQLSLLQHNHESQIAMGTGAGSNLTSRYAYWLRNIYSASTFCTVSSTGLANTTSASSSYGVRPVFLIY